MNVAGIDGHTTYSVLVIVNKEGEIVVGPERIGNRDGAGLMQRLEGWTPLAVVMETSPTWPWIRDLVAKRARMEFVLAHATQLRAIAHSHHKRDEVDAELLARMHLAGLIPQVYARDAEQRDRTHLVRHRARLVRQRTRAANRIHAQLHAVGLRLDRGRLLTKKGRKWVRDEAWSKWQPQQRLLAETHFEIIDVLTAQVRTLDRRVDAVAKTVPGAMLLQSIPGVGSYRSLVMATEIEPVKRFARPEQLVSYAGLAPRTRRSGLAPIRHGRIPAGANRWLRGAYVRAVVSHRQHAPDSELSQFYDRQKERIGWQAARIATARKLARATHAMLRTGELWRDA